MFPRCLGSFCLVKSRGFAHLATLGLVSLMLHCALVKTVELVDLIEMRKADCFGETTYIARHELESEVLIICKDDK